jgi:hypothetical protein
VSGALFIALGAAGMAVIGWESWFFCGIFVAIGAIAIAGGWAALRVRITVDAVGIRNTFWTTELIAWSSVQAWGITPPQSDQRQLKSLWAALYDGRGPAFLPRLVPDNNAFQALLLRITDEQQPIEFYDGEIEPSFPDFIDEVRAQIGDKEMTIERAKMPTAN